MADFGIKPEIALGVKTPQTSLADLVGMAGKAIEVQKMSELYPEYIRLTKAQAAGAETGAEKSAMELNLSKAQQIANGQMSMIFNPLVVKAEQQPEQLTQDERNKLVNLVTQNAQLQAKNAGIPWEGKGQELARPYIERAINDPGSLKSFFLERQLAGVDQATRLGAMTPRMESVSGRPAVVQPMTGTISEPTYIGGPTPSTTPAIGGAAPSAAAGAPVAQPAKPELAVGPGYDLKFPVISPTDVRPRPIGYEEALASGKEYRERVNKAKDSVPTAVGYLDEVMRLAGEIGADSIFTTGKLGDIERSLRQFMQDPRYQELSKNIARGELMILQAQGGSLQTDAGKDLIAKASGTSSYDPSVLAGIVKKQLAEFQNIKMQAEGARRASQNYTDANLEGFREAWAKNSDLKVFEAMAIQDRIKNPKMRQEALDKVLPKNRAELQDFLTKLDNLTELSQTGRLKGR